jgi:hypothetical protein
MPRVQRAALVVDQYRATETGTHIVADRQWPPPRGSVPAAMLAMRPWRTTVVASSSQVNMPNTSVGHRDTANRPLWVMPSG